MIGDELLGHYEQVASAKGGGLMHRQLRSCSARTSSRPAPAGCAPRCATSPRATPRPGHQVVQIVPDRYDGTEFTHWGRIEYVRAPTLPGSGYRVITAPGRVIHLLERLAPGPRRGARPVHPARARALGPLGGHRVARHQSRAAGPPGRTLAARRRPRCAGWSTPPTGGWPRASTPWSAPPTGRREEFRRARRPQPGAGPARRRPDRLPPGQLRRGPACPPHPARGGAAGHGGPALPGEGPDAGGRHGARTGRGAAAGCGR